MASAKEKLKMYFLQHVGEEISRDILCKVSGNIQDWPRSLRQLRQETGWDIVSTANGYILRSDEPVREPQIRKNISERLRYAVLQRDNSTCQRCGANIHNTPNVKLVVDHKIPVDIGGETNIDNLWTLCSNCNGGKQAFFQDEDTETMNYVMSFNSAYKRLKAYFESYPNTVISPTKLAIISQVRDWERTLRKIRSDEGMNIIWVNPCDSYPDGGYIYEE